MPQSAPKSAPQSPCETRPFSVHARHVGGHHARVLHEASFEAAAVAYVEDFLPPIGGNEISIIVREVETGHEHSFRIDLESGDATPCG